MWNGRYSRKLAASLLFACLNVVFAAAALAQVLGTGATILGLVTDAQDAAVAGVEVVVTETATGVTYRTTTNTAGNYEFPALAIGHYRLEVKAAGFAEYVRRDMEILSGQRMRADVRLKLADIQQTIEVIGTPNLINTEQANTVHRVSGNAVADMPTYGHNSLMATRLVPGAVSVTRDDQFTSLGNMQLPNSVRYNGAPAQGNAVMVDGSPSTYGNGSSSYTPSSEAVQELSVQTFALSAENGQTGGAVVAIETKSGTNQLHGTAAHTMANSALNSLDHFARKARLGKAGMIANAPVVNIGGPVYLPKLYDGRNRTFFFFNYEWQRYKGSPLNASTTTVPTKEMRAGDFSQVLASNGKLIQIFDPLTTRYDSDGRTLIRDAFPGNVIPAARISPISRQMVDKLLPLPTHPGTVNNYVYQSIGYGPIDNALARVDHHFREGDNLSFTYGRNYVATSALMDPIILLSGYSEKYSFKHASLGYTHIFNPSTVFVLRAGAARTRLGRYSYFDTPIREAFGLPSQYLGLLQTPANVPPDLSITDAVGVTGTWRDCPYHSVTLRPSLNKIAGQHSLSMGYEFRVYRNFEYTPGNGSFSFARSLTQGPLASTSSTTAGHGVATLLLGTPTGGSVATNSAIAAQKTYHALFLQDNWRIGRRLTVNLGLRWDYEGPMTERYNRMNRGIDLTASSPIAVQAEANYAKSPVPERKEPFKVVGGLLFAGTSGLPRGGFDQRYDGFMPRVGMAYQASSKTVFRAGYGLYYVPMVSGMDSPSTGTLISMPTSQVGYSASTSMLATQEGRPVNTLANPLPQGIVQPSGASLGLATLLGQSISALDPSGTRPYTHQFQAGIQRELPGQVLFEVAYIGNRVRRLPTSLSLNWLQNQYLALGDDLTKQVPNPFYGIISTGTLSQPTVSKEQLLMQYPQFSAASLGQHTIGSSWFNGLQVTGTKRMARGLQFISTWTWSKNMEQLSYLNNPGEPLARNLIAPYSTATGGGGNLTHVVTLSGQWEVPFGTKRRFGGSLPKVVTYSLGNWELGWMITLATGQARGITGRVEQIRDMQEINPTEDKWFDTGAFRVRAPYTLRTVSLVSSHLKSDGIETYNFVVGKTFPIQERVNVRFQCQLLNVFNLTQFANPNTSVSSNAFGTVTTQFNQPRRIVFSAKVTF